MTSAHDHDPAPAPTRTALGTPHRRTLLSGGTAVCLTALLSSCASSDDDGEAKQASPSASPFVTPPARARTPKDGLPPGFHSKPLWSMALTGIPRAVTNGFLGFVDTSKKDGRIRLTSVTSDGTIRWQVTNHPACDGLVLTRVHGREAVILVDSDAGNSAHPEKLSTNHAFAYEVRSGKRIWGPVTVNGQLTGPGLLLGKQGSGSGPPPTALVAQSGHQVELPGGARPLHEYAGALLWRSGEHLAALDTTRRRTLWRGRELTRPHGVPRSATPRYRDIGQVKGPVALIRWGHGSSAQDAAYEVRSGHLLHSAPAASQPRVLTVHGSGRYGVSSGTVVFAEMPAHGRAGRTVAVDLRRGRARWSHTHHGRGADAPFTSAVLGGARVFASNGQRQVTLTLAGGHEDAAGDWASPLMVTRTSDGRLVGLFGQPSAPGGLTAFSTPHRPD